MVYRRSGMFGGATRMLDSICQVAHMGKIENIERQIEAARSASRFPLTVTGEIRPMVQRQMYSASEMGIQAPQLAA